MFLGPCVSKVTIKPECIQGDPCQVGPEINTFSCQTKDTSTGTFFVLIREVAWIYK